MSSSFSSTKAYRSSIKSSSQSLTESGSGASSSARKHSETSQHSSKSSLKDSSKPSSKISAKSSSKTPSITSSKHSAKSPPKHKSIFTLHGISTNGQSHGKSTQRTSPAIKHYAASPIHSNPHYTSSTCTMTEAEFQARMQALLDDIDIQMDLNDASVDIYGTQWDRYDTQLDLDEDDFGES